MKLRENQNVKQLLQLSEIMESGHQAICMGSNTGA